MATSQFFKEYGVSGLSIGLATLTTNPIDVVKVRLQLQRLKVEQGLRPRTSLRADGMLSTGINIVKREGALALWSGWQASMARSFFYGGARLGLYTPVRTALGADNSPSFWLNLAAGSTSGALAALICNPTELVKVRLQSKENQGRGPITVIKEVVQADGIRGLWRGTVPAATRAAILTASQVATYGEIKRRTAQTTGWGDGLKLHFSASMIAGLVSTTATSPADVIKTKLFVSGSKYSGPLHCLADMIRTEGMRSLFKGWLPNYCRLGPQTTITFVTVEKLRQLAGLDTLK